MIERVAFSNCLIKCSVVEFAVRAKEWTCVQQHRMSQSHCGGVSRRIAKFFFFATMKWVGGNNAGTPNSTNNAAAGPVTRTMRGIMAVQAQCGMHMARVLDLRQAADTAPQAQRSVLQRFQHLKDL